MKKSKPKLSEWQQLVVDHVPWVRRLVKPLPCEGWMARGRNCRNQAHWKFTASKRSYARSGVYCWSHLISRGIEGDMVEERRFTQQMYKHGVYCQSVSERGTRCWRTADPPHTEHCSTPYRRYPQEEFHSDEVWRDLRAVS